MAKKPRPKSKPRAAKRGRRSALLDTRVIYCGDNLERRAFQDRHASTLGYLDFMRLRCVELARVLKRTGHSINQLASNR